MKFILFLQFFLLFDLISGFPEQGKWNFVMNQVKLINTMIFLTKSKKFGYFLITHCFYLLIGILCQHNFMSLPIY